MNVSDSIVFRDIEKKDADEIYVFLNGLTDKEKSFFHPHPFDKKTIEEICSSKKDHYFVMTLGDKIIGYSFLRLFGYEVPSFGCCIRNEFQGKEYGKLITKLTIDTAKELGYKKIILKVYKDNIAAFKLYKKSGFGIVDKNKDTNEFKMAINLD